MIAGPNVLASPPAELVFPHPIPPPLGSPVEVAPGLLWLRLALPFQLDHINVYLLADGSGWCVLDTGVADLRTRAVWDHILASHRITRLIVTHFHPDHIGLAGWFDAPLAMTATEYDFARSLQQTPDSRDDDSHRDFYRRGGIDQQTAEALLTRGHNYLKLTTTLPETYQRLQAGDRLAIGRRSFELRTGGGHAPEQLMLHDRENRIFLPADQVLARISPNIGVWHSNPDANPLAAYLKSLAALFEIPNETLVLPAHNLPFYGLHTRLDQLISHHAARCADIARACAEAPRTVAEILPILFPRALDPHQRAFAFAEAQAHVNFMRHAGQLTRRTDAAGVEHFAA